MISWFTYKQSLKELILLGLEVDNKGSSWKEYERGFNYGYFIIESYS